MLLSSSDINELVIMAKFRSTRSILFYIFAITRCAFHSRLMNSWKITARAVHTSFDDFESFLLIRININDLRIYLSTNRNTFNRIKDHSITQPSYHIDEIMGSDSLMICSTLVYVWSLNNREILIILWAEIHEIWEIRERIG